MLHIFLGTLYHSAFSMGVSSFSPSAFFPTMRYRPCVVQAVFSILFSGTIIYLLGDTLDLYEKVFAGLFGGGCPTSR